MFKKILFAAVLFSPSALWANETEWFFSFSRRSENKCYKIGTNKDKCLKKAHKCFWDEEDGRCEPLNDKSGCGKITQPEECNASPKQCFWDEEDGRCERLSG